MIHMKICFLHQRYTKKIRYKCLQYIWLDEFHLLFFKDTHSLFGHCNQCILCNYHPWGKKNITVCLSFTTFKRGLTMTPCSREMSRNCLSLFTDQFYTQEAVRSLGWQKPVPPPKGLSWPDSYPQLNWPYSPLFYLCAAKIMLQVRSAQWSSWKLNIHRSC